MWLWQASAYVVGVWGLIQCLHRKSIALCSSDAVAVWHNYCLAMQICHCTNHGPALLSFYTLFVCLIVTVWSGAKCQGCGRVFTQKINCDVFFRCRRMFYSFISICTLTELKILWSMKQFKIPVSRTKCLTSWTITRASVPQCSPINSFQNM